MNSQQLPDKEIISRCRMLVVGDVMLDRYWNGEVTRISPEAPVPIVHISREEFRLGGAGNVALNLSTLGARVTLLGVVGQDDSGRILQSILVDNDINGVLLNLATIQTNVKLRILGRSQQIVRVDFEKELDSSVSEGILKRFEEIVGEQDAIIFSDYGKGSLVCIAQMIELARASGKRVFVDPKGVNWERYNGVNLITPNRSELRQIIGAWSDEEELAKKVLCLSKKLDFNALLLTRSEEGMTLYEAGLAHSIPAETREVADVSGAGDTVIATMALMLTCGINSLVAMGMANKAAGLVVSKFGTSTITYEELKSEFYEFRQ